MHTDTRIYVAGHTGMAGSAVVRRLREQGYNHLLTIGHAELDLCEQGAVRDFLRAEKPDVVIVAAAKVGGILANSTYPAEFIRGNLAVALNLVHEAWQAGVPRLLFLGSTCIYPRLAPQPMCEDALLTGPLEPTNEAYAVAKIAGLKLCQFYRRQYGVCYHSAMPTNLYGPGDNYNLANAHVLPALIRKFHAAHTSGAATVTLWGTGRPRREFLYVDDLADALIALLRADAPPDWVNVGTGRDVTIAELAEAVRATVGFAGRVVYDPEQPDGTPRKLTDSTLMRGLGWSADVDLQEGLRRTYADFLAGLQAGCLRT
jgi:GDP-L-fucose synthase